MFKSILVPTDGSPLAEKSFTMQNTIGIIAYWQLLQCLLKSRSVQLEFFPFDDLNAKERAAILTVIRQSYWHLRNLRGGRFGQAAARRYYRRIAGQKNACSWQAFQSMKFWIF